jgi:hypothetical protein
MRGECQPFAIFEGLKYTFSIIIGTRGGYYRRSNKKG